MANQASQQAHATASQYQETRQYHDNEEAQYALPNDSPEHIRLTTQAMHLSRMMDNHVVHAPLTNPNRILDVGCGTGVMTVSLAQHFPEAQCYGIDLSPVPETPERLPNVHFHTGNILSSHTAESIGLYDYVFSRLLVLGITDWAAYISRASALLEPGGWLEIQDLDSHFFSQTSPPTDISDELSWYLPVVSACESKGFDLRCGTAARERMLLAGFTDVQTFSYRYPFGGKVEEGFYGEKERAFAKFNDENTPALLHFLLQKTMEDTQTGELTKEMRDEMDQFFDGKEGRFMPFTVTIGRKPL